MKSIKVGEKQVPIAVLILLLAISGGAAVFGVSILPDSSGGTASTVDNPVVVRNISAGPGSKDPLGMITDDATRFRFTAYLEASNESNVTLTLSNLAKSPITGRLRLEIPPQIELQMNSTDIPDFQVSRSNESTWTFYIDAANNSDDATGNLSIWIVRPNDTNPGFYTIKGEVRVSDE